MRTAALRTNWFRVLDDLQRKHWTHVDVAKHLDVALGTLLGWKQGAEPRHRDGERLLDLWRAVTERDRADRPLTVD